VSIKKGKGAMIFPMTFMVIWLLVFAASVKSQAVFFDDSDSEIMILSNTSSYEIGFRKSNGSIAYIRNPNAGNHISSGSRFQQLWGTVALNGDPVYIGGANYSPSSPNNFGYDWDSATNKLSLRYTPDPNAQERISVLVEITVSESSFFDCRLSLTNDRSVPLDSIAFPSDLVFMEDEITDALFPWIPGILLKAPFFQEDRSYQFRYPGRRGFADYVSVNHQSGFLCLYSLFQPEQHVPIVDFGFTDDDEYIANSTFLGHTFHVYVRSGESWISPTVRIRIGQNHLETINAYRTDNGIHDFPSIHGKLGNNFQRVRKAPVLKADFRQLRWNGLEKFTDYNSFLPTLPAPSILHLVSYHTGGHDTHYPDFYPPDPVFGTVEEFRALFDKAHSLGIMVMPYINPTWWNEESMTMQNELPPLTMDDIASLDANGQPVFNSYGPNTGIAVSPQHPFVVKRLHRLMREMTEDLPSDFVLEDQIGARSGFRDFNPTLDAPTSYSEKWLEHTRRYADKYLATEDGFDRLLETEVGFHGSLLLMEKNGAADQWFGRGNWDYYPFTPIAAHDKILFYQHDLAPETTTSNQRNLAWNLAFGFMLTYDLSGDLQKRPDWLRLVSQFQSHVCYLYAGEKMTDYVLLQNGVTQSVFETIDVIANWNEASPFSISGHTIPPQGAFVVSHDGSLEAGVFTSFNGTSLSPGNHYIIVERDLSGDNVMVFQPLGNDTEITIQRPANWTDAESIFAIAVSGDKTFEVPRTVKEDGITFLWRREMEDANIDYYILTGLIGK